MLIAVCWFLVGFALLIKGGDWFVDGAVGICRRFHLPELLIGATVVSIGTTLPEVMVSTQAAVMGNAGISYGNAIGSVICNTSLIAALTITFRPGPADGRSFRLPAGFFFAAALSYGVIAWTTGRFRRWEGIVYLAVFAVYLVWSTLRMKKSLPPVQGEPGGETADPAQPPLWRALLLLAVGAAAIAWGADLLVDNGTLIAAALGVPDSVVGLTMVALGTSLPELVTAVTSLVKGHGELSVGNVIGANLFNIVEVSGAAITISPFVVPAEKTIGRFNSSLVIDIPLMLIVMAILCVPAIRTGRLRRWQGVVLLCVYAAFTAYQFLS